MPADVGTGFLTPDSAAILNAAIATGYATKLELDNWAEPQVDEFPALWTAYDASTGKCSWTEQAYDSEGRRYIKPGGRTGNASYMPAYPVGNGVLPPAGLSATVSGSGATTGIEVWMRRRGAANSVGWTFEFDWVCACTSYYGSGSGT